MRFRTQDFPFFTNNILLPEDAEMEIKDTEFVLKTVVRAFKI